MDRVDALPAARGVGPLTGGPDLDAERPLAAGLHLGVGRLHQDREVGLHELGMALAEQVEPVELRVDLLGLVEDVGDVAVGLGDRGGQPQDDRVAALHVAGAEPVQQVALTSGRQVVVDRHRVEMAGDDDPLAAAQVGAGDDGVAVPGHREMRERRQRDLDRVRDRLLVPADRLDVDELDREVDGAGGQVELGGRAGRKAGRCQRAP